MNPNSFQPMSEDEQRRIEELKEKIRQTNDLLLIEELKNEAIAIIEKAMLRFKEYVSQRNENGHVGN